ncbi:glucose-6-phosphate isomerase [Pseudoteredinibacter isoporae]|uniref:Glucose-6-phosphate isomerase n=1 Tax=Pseudoteredinibacter isoporae TaxID=570281 RepID=A0A7X0JPP6_9GAMM|nr:glucose-6-phosphate isomerase [Pseudoteredinibacter isoporae]MBB6520017.1 glucose-6-phosphate isomerase [Pseudoteredinibacter isoporae]NHO85589.1 glucose-6-phosphate isomerase [Pseudoteredinibacter isoporae]NIB25959.1 glucose-6-phosphate isomerase [Pseudoteredinibacter isoporae]
MRTQLDSWRRLKDLAEPAKHWSLQKLFSQDAERAARFSLELPDMYLDYSKNLIDEEVMGSLFDLAEEVGLVDKTRAMFSGEMINTTENRAVLHTALRDSSGSAVQVNGENVQTKIAAELAKMQNFVELVRDGEWRGSTRKKIRDVVSLGVGGSNLGPKMVSQALKPYADSELRVHYVSNVDGNSLAETLRPLNPQTVLFVVSSKTFTTTETMTNARTALNWLESALFDKKAVEKHVVAVTSDFAKAREFGVLEENIFEMWDWVGGRFSLWSAIGLPIALELGFDNFEKLLRGAENMDKHFLSAPINENAPVLLALLSLWNTTFLNFRAQAILPYDQGLHLFSAYMQQAEMESNGKSVNIHGEPIDYQTVPLIWGQTGIDGQHAFYQYLHQGMNVVPADFIGSVSSEITIEHHQDILLANLIAQSQALMNGVDANSLRRTALSAGCNLQEMEQIIPHKVHQGNRPSNTILLPRLDPNTLGALIALYEHKIFAQGVLLDICSFDQWGVELGKKQANEVQQALTKPGRDEGEFDSSTRGLIAYCHKHRSLTV